jgi:type I restriction enzyme S subunit
VEGEQPVRLCNYTDVYNNDFITPELNFMDATATLAEISKFVIRKGDVIVTKDSESWDDIAVPAFVKCNIPSLVCGYHLAMVRPNDTSIEGAYLFRSFSSPGINDQFRVEATGITRFGLAIYALSNGLFLVPSSAEQRAIAEFLDRETARIDALIEKKERQIELLQEKRAALISHAVKKGLNPNVKMRDSGVEWLGEIPAHWQTIKLKRVVTIIDGDRGQEYPNENDLVDNGIPFLSSKNIVNDRFDLSEARFITTEKFHRLGRGKLKDDDIVITVRGTIGSVARFVNDIFETAFINAQMMILRPSNGLSSQFLHFLATGDYWRTEIDVCSYGTAQQQLSNEILANLLIAVPPFIEQCSIVSILNKKTREIDRLISKVQASIHILGEHRAAVISAAVTGKIDVREVLRNAQPAYRNGL